MPHLKQIYIVQIHLSRVSLKSNRSWEYIVKEDTAISAYELGFQTIGFPLNNLYVQLYMYTNTVHPLHLVSQFEFQCNIYL